jgi:hypothetical protein
MEKLEKSEFNVVLDDLIPRDAPKKKPLIV